MVDGRYTNTHTVASFAAVFPTEGPIDEQRYFVLILVDDPKGYPRTGAYVAAPVAGRVINRIAPFLNVRRTDEPAVAATSSAIDEDER